MSENDIVYSWNGLRPDGQKFAIDPTEFVMWASAYHPEYLENDGTAAVSAIVLSEHDAKSIGLPELEGTVLVTCRPEWGDTSYAEVAYRAARFFYSLDIRMRFTTLGDMFKAENFTTEDFKLDNPVEE